MKKQILNKKGSSYIDIAISILIISFILVFCISIFSVLWAKISLDRITDTITDYVSYSGQVNDEIIEKIEELKTKSKINFSYYFDCEYYNQENQIQLGDKITFYASANIKIMGIFDFEIKSSQTKLSKVYFK